MKKLIFSIIAIAAFICVSNAQMRYTSDGQIYLGEESVDAPNVLRVNYDSITRIKVFGIYGDYRAGGRISFGDQCALGAMNVMIGEMGKEDCDILWLHGKKGLYYTTTTNASDTVFFYDTNKGNYFNFNCDVRSTGIFVASDSRFKDNIAPIDDNAAASLRSLTAVSYSLKPRFGQSPMTRSAGSAGTSKDAKDQEFFDNFHNSLNNDSLRYGFIAQEVQEVFPELVRTDKDGYMYVDYIGMIPLLVNAINDLQAQLDAATAPGGNIGTRDTGNDAAVASTDDISASVISPSLAQNAPNPFNAETVIAYSLPETVAVAHIYIYNMQGTQIAKYELEDRGNASITITAERLAPGMYIYALIADGQEIDTKRMVLTD